MFSSCLSYQRYLLLFPILKTRFACINRHFLFKSFFSVSSQDIIKKAHNSFIEHPLSFIKFKLENFRFKVSNYHGAYGSFPILYYKEFPMVYFRHMTPWARVFVSYTGPCGNAYRSVAPLPLYRARYVKCLIPCRNFFFAN
jgi:hypothetical protein